MFHSSTMPSGYVLKNCCFKKVNFLKFTVKKLDFRTGLGCQPYNFRKYGSINHNLSNDMVSEFSKQPFLKLGCIQNQVEHLRWSFITKIVNGFQPLTIFTKSSIVDVRLGFKYASEMASSVLQGSILSTMSIV